MVVHFKNIGLRILPVDAEGHTFLVGQYRYGAGYFSWQLPAGNQDPDEDRRDGATRELREEVGQIATEWLDLARPRRVTAPPSEARVRLPDGRVPGWP